MGKEILPDTNTDPPVISRNRPGRNSGITPEIVPKKVTSDKIDAFEKRNRLTPRYSDFYEEFDDLEKNEDTFAQIQITD
jgi:hypothetical protein